MWKPVSFARLIVAKLEYVGPTDKSPSQFHKQNYTLSLWSLIKSKKKACLTMGLHIDMFKLYLRPRNKEK